MDPPVIVAEVPNDSPAAAGLQPREAILAGGWSRVEFTTFRATARRRLALDEFDKVDQLYQHAAAQTDNWLAEYHHLHQA
jgi:hypothetical protein